MNTKKSFAIAGIVASGLAFGALASVALADRPMHAFKAERFAALDANGDGKVTLAEMKAGEQKRFAEIDTNRDGRLTKEELAAHHDAMREKMRAARGKDADSKHPGKHGKGEGKHRKGEGKHGKFGEKMFSKFDSNGDGVIDAQESAAKAEKMFSRMDKNGDGAVTQDELRGGCERGHGKRHDRGGKGAQQGAAGSGPADG